MSVIIGKDPEDDGVSHISVASSLPDPLSWWGEFVTRKQMALSFIFNLIFLTSILIASVSYLANREYRDVVEMKKDEVATTKALLEGQRYTNEQVGKMIHGMDELTKALVEQDKEGQKQ